MSETLPGNLVSLREQHYDYRTTGELWHVTREPHSTDTSIYQRVTFTHDGNGRPIRTEVSDLPGTAIRTAAMTWDAAGVFPATHTNQLDQVTTYLAWDEGKNLLLRVLDPAGVEWVTQYDALGNLRATQAYKGNSAITPLTEVAYQLIDDLVDPLVPWAIEVTTTTAGEAERIATFDALGRATFLRSKNFEGLWSSVRRDFNAQGLLHRQSTPYKQPQNLPDGWTTYGYDGLGRIVASELPTGESHLVRYAPRITWTQNPAGKWTRHIKNSRGETVRTLSGMPTPNHGVTPGSDVSELCNEYGSWGRMTQTGGCAKNTPSTSLSYDLLGRPRSQSSAELGYRTFTYNTFGERIAATDPNGNTITYVADVLGRPYRRTSSQGTATWTWDSEVVGALTRSESETGERIEYGYNALDQVDRVTYTVQGETFDFFYTYDPQGRIKDTVYPEPATLDPVRTRNVYGPNGHLQAVLDAYTLVPYWELEAVSAGGQIEQERAGNDVVTRRTYDPLTGKITWIDTRLGANPRLQWLEYEWNENGHLHKRTDHVNGQNETFGYDAKDRVTSSDLWVGLNHVVASFTYDDWGNLTSKTGVGSYSYTDFRLTAAGGIAFTYDANGNLATRAGGTTTTFTYTPLDKPRYIDVGPTQLELEYDADHQRVWRRDAAALADTVTVGLYERERVGAAGSQTVTHKVSIPANGRIVAQVMQYEGNGVTPSEAAHYLHDDHLGSNDLVTSATGVVVDSQSFDVWGNPRSHTQWDQAAAAPASDVTYGFGGHTRRFDRSVLHLRGRMYDPIVGRFVQPDPYVQAPLEMASHNRYAAMFNAPITFTDPSGYCSDVSGPCPPPPPNPFDPLPGDVPPGQGPPSADPQQPQQPQPPGQDTRPDENPYTPSPQGSPQDNPLPRPGPQTGGALPRPPQPASGSAQLGANHSTFLQLGYLAAYEEERRGIEKDAKDTPLEVYSDPAVELGTTSDGKLVVTDAEVRYLHTVLTAAKLVPVPLIANGAIVADHWLTVASGEWDAMTDREKVLSLDHPRGPRTEPRGRQSPGPRELRVSPEFKQQARQVVADGGKITARTADELRYLIRMAQGRWQLRGEMNPSSIHPADARVVHFLARSLDPGMKQWILRVEIGPYVDPSSFLH